MKVRTENLTAGDKAQDTTIEIRLWDKTKALELGAKANGWLIDRVIVEGLDERKARLRSALARVALTAGAPQVIDVTPQRARIEGRTDGE